MNIAHLIIDLNPVKGGPTTSVLKICNALSTKNSLELVCLESKIKKEHLHFKQIVVGHNKKLKISKYVNLFNQLKKNLNNYNIVHIHGVWSLFSLISIYISVVKKKTFFITPHGSLMELGLKKKYLVKKLILFFFYSNLLKKSSGIIINSKKELIESKMIIKGQNYFIIPHFIELNKRQSTIKINKVGYIGRLHPIKNLESLIRTWPINLDINLIIAGKGEKQYFEKLKTLSINKSIQFIGHVTDETKEKFFKSIDILILPSISENFGIVILEALSRGIIVIASKGTPWGIIEQYNCGFWIDQGLKDLPKVLRVCQSLSKEQIEIMSKNAQNLIKNNFTNEIIIEKYNKVYDRYL